MGEEEVEQSKKDRSPIQKGKHPKTLKIAAPTGKNLEVEAMVESQGGSGNLN